MPECLGQFKGLTFLHQKTVFRAIPKRPCLLSEDVEGRRTAQVHSGYAPNIQLKLYSYRALGIFLLVVGVEAVRSLTRCEGWLRAVSQSRCLKNRLRHVYYDPSFRLPVKTKIIAEALRVGKCRRTRRIISKYGRCIVITSDFRCSQLWRRRRKRARDKATLQWKRAGLSAELIQDLRAQFCQPGCMHKPEQLNLWHDCFESVMQSAGDCNDSNSCTHAHSKITEQCVTCCLPSLSSDMLRAGGGQSKHERLMDGLNSLIEAFKGDDNDHFDDRNRPDAKDELKTTRRQKQRQKDDLRVDEVINSLEQLLKEARRNPAVLIPGLLQLAEKHRPAEQPQTRDSNQNSHFPAYSAWENDAMWWWDSSSYQPHHRNNWDSTSWWGDSKEQWWEPSHTEWWSPTSYSAWGADVAQKPIDPENETWAQKAAKVAHKQPPPPARKTPVRRLWPEAWKPGEVVSCQGLLKLLEDENEESLRRLKWP